jgi:hypothetical protein
VEKELSPFRSSNIQVDEEADGLWGLHKVLVEVERLFAKFSVFLCSYIHEVNSNAVKIQFI